MTYYDDSEGLFLPLQAKADPWDVEGILPWLTGINSPAFLISGITSISSNQSHLSYVPIYMELLLNEIKDMKSIQVNSSHVIQTNPQTQRHFEFQLQPKTTNTLQSFILRSVQKGR